MIKVFPNNAFQENTYVLTDDQTHQCVLIDPGMNSEWEWRAVREYIEHEQLTPVAIWLTHGHVDHQMGTGYLTDLYSIPVCGPVEDCTQLPDVQMQSQLFGVPITHNIASVTRNIVEGDTLHVGNLEVKVLDCPGHSFHGLCFYLPVEGAVFTGDVLFCCSIGRSDFGPQMGGNGELLIEGIRSKLMSLPPATKVYPGHGPATSIQNEITYNPYF